MALETNVTSIPQMAAAFIRPGDDVFLMAHLIFVFQEIPCRLRQPAVNLIGRLPGIGANAPYPGTAQWSIDLLYYEQIGLTVVSPNPLLALEAGEPAGLC